MHMVKIVRKLYTRIKILLFRFKYQLSNITISGKRWMHIGVWGMNNAGDTVLYIEVENLINKFARKKTGFLKSDIHQTIYDQNKIRKINKKANAIIVGGGGLFLKDTNPNNISGWQWNIDIQSINNIEIPLVLFAVGYNRFRNQDDFDPVFFENLNALCKKSIFIGLRNHGSLNAIKSVVDEEYHDRLFFQPCPTTVLNHIYPNHIATKPGKQRISINLAFDRKDLRFNSNFDNIINEIFDYKERMERNDCEILFVGHCGIDKEILQYGKDIKFIDLTTKTPAYIKNYYRKSSITIGMRGHAQMIPFGLGMPVLSLISHEKLKFFLDDIDHPEWGVEISEPGLSQVLYNKSMHILENWEEIASEIQESQEHLVDVTRRNIEYIQSRIR